VQRGADLLHTFLKPGGYDSVQTLLSSSGVEQAKALYQNASETFRRVVELPDPQALYYLEVGLHAGEGRDPEDLVATVLDGLNPLGGDHFVEDTDYFTYMTRAPPVIEGEKKRGVCPQPSVCIMVDSGDPTEKYLECCYSYVHGQLDHTEVLIMPLVPSKIKNCPMFVLPESNSDLVFFVLVLASAVPSDANVVDQLRMQHRELQSVAQELGGKRYPYDNVQFEDSTAWRAHFGEDKWRYVCTMKGICDPENTLGASINLFNE